MIEDTPEVEVELRLTYQTSHFFAGHETTMRRHWLVISRTTGATPRSQALVSDQQDNDGSTFSGLLNRWRPHPNETVGGSSSSSSSSS